MAPIKAMTARGYEIVAGIINTMPDDIRQRVADHFAQEFNARFVSFDPGAWEARTGGVPGKHLKVRDTDAERAERVKKYLESIGSDVDFEVKA